MSLQKQLSKLRSHTKKRAIQIKKRKVLAIRHLLENKKTITEVSEILFKAYNAIKNWWQAFKKDGIRGLETKKYPAVRQRSKTEHFWSLWRQRQRKSSILFLKILRVI